MSVADVTDLYQESEASMNIDQALALITNEVERAQSIYSMFASAHEGYAVLLEEMDELKDEVWKSPKKRDYDAMLKEAMQVAAMAVRLMIEIAAPVVRDEGRTVTCANGGAGMGVDNLIISADSKARVDTTPAPADKGIASYILSALQYYGPMTLAELEIKLNKPINQLSWFLTALTRQGKVTREKVYRDDTERKYYRYTAVNVYKCEKHNGARP
jgi:hypothetical protein